MTTTASRFALVAALIGFGAPAWAQAQKFSDEVVFTFTPDAGTKDVVDDLNDIKNNNSNISLRPNASPLAAGATRPRPSTASAPATRAAASSSRAATARPTRSTARSPATVTTTRSASTSRSTAAASSGPGRTTAT